MRKKIVILMAAMCLAFWGSGMYVSAIEYKYCPQCKAGLGSYTQDLDHWFETRDFKEVGGSGIITFYENHYMNREVKYCTNGCGIVWEGEPIETVTHSVAQCPYNK